MILRAYKALLGGLSMVRYENECVDCGLPCMGDRCPNRHVKRLYCDRCEDEVDTLYIVDGEELCDRCALDALEKIE